MADWIHPERFDKTEYGRLAKELPSGAPYYDPFTPDMLPPGASIVPDPKDGKFGIIKGRNGKPLAKASLARPVPTREDEQTQRKTGRRLAMQWGLQVRQALYRRDGDWYHPLRNFPSALIDAHGYVLFNSSADYQSCPQLQIKQRVHVPTGIKRISGYVRMVAPLNVVSKAPAARNPPWSAEELILALRLYIDEGLLDDKHTSVIKLSELLNSLPFHSNKPDAARFRNPNGVALKLANFAALDPSYYGKGMSRGDRRDMEIWKRYSGDEDALYEAARRIRAGQALAYPTNDSSAPLFTRTSVEAFNNEHFIVERRTSSGTAQRREQQLVIAYHAYLESQKHDVSRHRYVVDGRVLSCDLFDETAWCLFEAKGDVSRESIRMAAGQLFDYRRFYAGRKPRLSVLVPRCPSDDLMAFLRSVGVQAVFRSSGGTWVEHAR